MRRRFRAALVAVFLCSSGCVTQQEGPHISFAPNAECQLSEADRAWIGASTAAWRLTETEILRLPPLQQEPQEFLFDAACVYASDDGWHWTAAPHHGQIDLPHGMRTQAIMQAFALRTDDGGAFFVMALPSVWATWPGAAAALGDVPLQTFMTSVYVHEHTHIRHYAALGARVEAVQQAFGAPLGSAAVQERFERAPGFEDSLNRERSALYDAAESGDVSRIREAAQSALAERQTRVATFFTAEAGRYAPADDYCVALEGVAAWAAYKWLSHPRGGALTQAHALDKLRSNRDAWSENEGFAIMLAVERLMPDWRDNVFGAEPMTATQLLAVATS